MPFLASSPAGSRQMHQACSPSSASRPCPLGEPPSSLQVSEAEAGRYTAEVTAGSREQDVVTTTTQGSHGCIWVTSTLDEPGGPQGCPRQRGRIDMGHRPNKSRWRRLCPVPDLRVGRSKITPPVASPTVQVVAADRLYGAPSTGHSGGVAFVESSAVVVMVGDLLRRLYGGPSFSVVRIDLRHPENLVAVPNRAPAQATPRPRSPGPAEGRHHQPVIQVRRLAVVRRHGPRPPTSVRMPARTKSSSSTCPRPVNLTMSPSRIPGVSSATVPWCSFR